MGKILELLGVPLCALMTVCYNLVHSYVFAIIIFTALTKIILLPVSMWVQRNSIAMVRLMPELNKLKIQYFGDQDAIAEGQQALYKKERYNPLISTVPMIIQIFLLIGVIGAVKALLGGAESMLNLIPSQVGGVTLLMPLGAGLAALGLTLAQNKISPLQREQAKAEQLMTGVVTVGISVFLGAFVSLGTGVYWIASNLLTIPQQLLLNQIIKPEKYVDYKALRKSQKELAEINSMGAGISAEDKKREKADYKRFFSIANKHLVFYSEKSGFYKYFQDVIEYLLTHSNVVIHYITSDPKDAIFEKAKTETKIKPYYIGEKRLITLMMKMDADIVVMTMPDLGNFHIKRSYIRKDIEYIYMLHGSIGSTNLLLRKGALDNYDTIFCAGPLQIEELRETEKVYGLQPRNLILCGYGLLEHSIEQHGGERGEKHTKPQILIAPSWQKDNILESCIDPILESLLTKEYRIIVRPHPEYIKRYPQKIADLEQRYRSRFNEDFILQTDFSSNETVFESDLLITDWSTICFEYSFATKRPTLFIDTPMKVMNPEYKRLSMVPIDISIRSEIGKAVAPEETGTICDVASEMLSNQQGYHDQIESAIQKYLYTEGKSGAIGGKYILKQLVEKRRNAKTV